MSIPNMMGKVVVDIEEITVEGHVYIIFITFTDGTMLKIDRSILPPNSLDWEVLG